MTSLGEINLDNFLYYLKYKKLSPLETIKFNLNEMDSYFEQRNSLFNLYKQIDLNIEFMFFRKHNNNSYELFIK